MDRLLVYGAYGYTGSLVSREAIARGGSPVLAGRDRDRLGELAADLGVEYRQFDLEGTTADLAAELESIDAVLNCAGPFVDTAEPLVEACLSTGTDYLDVTGEFRVFDRLADRDERAVSAGCTVLPGVGFDVVPSDCLAAFLAEHCPNPTDLTVGVATTSSLSRGTARTVLRNLGAGGVVRRRNRLVAVPTAYDVRDIDYGPDVGTMPSISVPMGDVVTAAHSTGVDRVTVYAGASRRAIRLLTLVKRLEPVAAFGPVKSGLEWLVDRQIEGPDGGELARDRAIVWAELANEALTVRGRLGTPNPYAFTADAAVTAVQGVLGGGVDAGFQTPATAFGPDFVLECGDVRRVLLQGEKPVET